MIRYPIRLSAAGPLLPVAVSLRSHLSCLTKVMAGHRVADAVRFDALLQPRRLVHAGNRVGSRCHGVHFETEDTSEDFDTHPPTPATWLITRSSERARKSPSPGHAREGLHLTRDKRTETQRNLERGLSRV